MCNLADGRFWIERDDGGQLATGWIAMTEAGHRRRRGIHLPYCFSALSWDRDLQQKPSLGLGMRVEFYGSKFLPSCL